MTIVRFFALAVIVLSSFATSAFAQSIPPGSYQRNCKNIVADGYRMTAICRKRSGTWNFSTLDAYHRCRGDIANDNGRLLCIERSQDDDTPPEWSPPGSYKQSCRRIAVDRGTIIAECRDRHGRWRYTELENFRRCRADIANIDGMLRCQGASTDTPESTEPLPSGSWRNSCINARIFGGVLYAECRNRIGLYVQTSIAFRRCNMGVINQDGRLACGYGSDQEGRARIVLYKHTRFSGMSRSFTGDVIDLNAFSFGNTASSVVIQSGVWQICDKPLYRGYCIVLDRSQSKLQTINFDDRAESIRRLR